MASQEKREFDKYLKFLTFKATQVIVQSRKGRRTCSKSNPHGNDWFNLSIVDDKQVSSELKRSLEGRLPQPGQPVCVEILMETAEGDSIVLEIWSIDLDHSKRDVSVSVAHLLYPRLSLMLRSLVVVSRTTPAYRLSRKQEEDIKFTFRVYAALPDISTKEFKMVLCARTSCPYGTISLSLLYRETITLPERPAVESLSIGECMLQPPAATDNHYDSLVPGPLPHLPFAPHTSHHSSGHTSLDHTLPFVAILPQREEFHREESHDTMSSSDNGQSLAEREPLSMAVEHEQDGYIMVDLADIKPTFATHTHVDELGDLLQKCRDVPSLDLLSGENSMDLEAAIKLIEEKTESGNSHSTNTTVNLT